MAEDVTALRGMVEQFPSQTTVTIDKAVLTDLLDRVESLLEPRQQDVENMVELANQWNQTHNDEAAQALVEEVWAFADLHAGR